MYEYWLEHMSISSTAHLNWSLLLIIDRHASHLSLKILDILKVNQVICLILPCHPTHALQPLDVSSTQKRTSHQTFVSCQIDTKPFEEMSRKTAHRLQMHWEWFTFIVPRRERTRQILMRMTVGDGRKILWHSLLSRFHSLQLNFWL